MDKYEYRLKTEHIKRLAAKKEYASAVKICDGIDWNKVKDVKMLTAVSDIYEAVGRYQEAIDVLIQAYQYAPIGRRIVYRLTELAVDCGNYKDAEEYYEEFCNIAPNDMGRIILNYKLEKAKGAKVEDLIKILEKYKEEDFDERWSYELAELYAKAGRKQDCISLCDDIILWFGLGKYVDKALYLKAKFAPLSEVQRQKLKNGQHFYEEGSNVTFVQLPDEEQEHFQAELAESVVSITSDEKEEEKDSVSIQVEDDTEEKTQKESEIPEYSEMDPAIIEENTADEDEGVLTQENSVDEAMAFASEPEESAETFDQNAEETPEIEEEQEAEEISEVEEASETEENQETEEISEAEETSETEENRETEEISEAEESSETEENQEIEEIRETEEKSDTEENTEIEPIQETEEAEPAVEVEMEESAEEEIAVSREPETETLSEAVEPMEEAETEAVVEEEPEDDTLKFSEPGSFSVEEQIRQLSQMIEKNQNLGDQTGEVSVAKKDISEEENEKPHTDEKAGHNVVADPADESGVWHFFVKSENSEEGFRFAVDKLRAMRSDGKNRPSTIARTKGAKLNGKSIIKTLDKLLGKAVIVEQAGGLGKEVLDEFAVILDKNDRSLIVVFIDTEEEINRIIEENPKLAEVFSAQFHAKTYTVEDLMEYARTYADEKDCAIDETARLLVTTRLEKILKDNPVGWQTQVEKMLDDAVENGNKKSVGRALKGLFVIRYDDEGRLLLKEEDFK